MTRPRLVLPLPPSDNQSHRLVMRGPYPARIRTAETRRYERDIGWLATQWMQRTGWRVPPADVPVMERVWIWWPNHRKHDPANVFKVLHDALKGVVVVDDDQIWPQVWGIAWDPRFPRIEVELAQKGEAHNAKV